MKYIIIFCILVLANTRMHAQQQAAPSFKDAELNTVYTHYISLKDALVASKANEAKQAATALQKSLTGIQNGKKASEQAAIIASSTDLTGQRTAFSLLSNEMKTLVKGHVSSGALYLKYCPMANNNTGAYWLSNEKKIMNPYFGDQMLHCGSVKETIQ
jgi:hypothetical protein